MPSIKSEIDAQFYKLIHKLVNSDENRRGHPRDPFPSIHKVAPYDGSNLPQPPDFVDVCCHDLSRSGFSYLSPIRPSLTNLIAAFGILPDITCMEARIVRTTDVLQHPSTGLLEEVGDPNAPIQYEGPDGKSGVPLILVSCEFVRRLKYAESISWT